MEIFRVYSDPGYTGANLNRPGLKEMLADVERKKIEHLDFINSKKSLPRPKTKPAPGTPRDAVLFDAPENSGALSPLRRTSVPNIRDGKDFAAKDFKDFLDAAGVALGFSGSDSVHMPLTSVSSSGDFEDVFERTNPAKDGV